MQNAVWWQTGVVNAETQRFQRYFLRWKRCAMSDESVSNAAVGSVTCATVSVLYVRCVKMFDTDKLIIEIELRPAIWEVRSNCIHIIHRNRIHIHLYTYIIYITIIIITPKDREGNADKGPIIPDCTPKMFNKTNDFVNHSKMKRKKLTEKRNNQDEHIIKNMHIIKSFNIILVYFKYSTITLIIYTCIFET